MTSTQDASAPAVRRAIFLEKANCRYGAPMGRAEWLPANMGAAGKLQLVHVCLGNGGYDPGGAYWGYPNDLWHAEGDLDGEQERTRVFVRSPSREGAKREIWGRLPNVRFYR